MRESLCVWIYAMTNAIGSKKCQCGKAWEPQIRRAIAIAMVLGLCGVLQAQDFSVSNPKKTKYSETEASQAYAAAVLTVEQEYHCGILTPHFELILGDSDKIQFDEGKVYMKTWNVRTFRAAVIVMAINELLRPENIRRLEARIEAESKAMVPVEKLKR